MTFALVQEALQLLAQTYATYRDALRAPGITIVGCKNLRHLQHVVQIVHRLALSHKHDVGELVAFRQGINLIEDVCSREALLVTLLSGLAEEAVHLTSHLRRHAQRGTVMVGDVYCLDVLA